MTDKEVTKPRILAVDDSRVMRKAMSKVLGKEYDVIEAEHGEDAWTILLHDKDIEVVFTDLSMPYLDGFGLLKRIRESEEERFTNMPVVIITGKEDDDNTKHKVLEMGASDFITKPFDSAQLKARAQTHITLEKTSKKLSETKTKLEKQSAVDELTGLGGRRYFCKVGNENLAYVKRRGGQFISMRLDIDDFNAIFIANGKSFADNILQNVGKTLLKLCRQEDAAARVGLAKFALLLKDTDMLSATRLAERISEELNALEFKSKEHILRITTSIGLLEPHVQEDSIFEELVAETEKYMLKAVEQGGNQIVVKSLRKDYVRQSIDITTALLLLKKGDTEFLTTHTHTLSQQLLPLLEFLGDHASDEIREPLKVIKQQLEIDAEKISSEKS
ncbi:MAG: response regulator [Gammaproteobacteria bacterium]|nr:response regulator [Gammaproteobacteria bacterium]